MKEKQDSPDKKSGEENGTIIEMSLTEADAERLKKAIADGLLDEYGVKVIYFKPVQEEQPGKKQWTQKNRRNRSTPRDDDTPSEPSR